MQFITYIFAYNYAYYTRGDLFMDDKKKEDSQKSATDNKWISTGLTRPNDKSERKDGPGGEDAD